jgi:hypothetical protein
LSALNWYGVGAFAAIAFVFYFVRHVAVYVVLCLAVVAAFAVGASRLRDPAGPSESLVLTLGLSLCVFGLLTVRIMLIRSVSLRLLERMDSGAQKRFGEDIGARLFDMRAFGLIRTTGQIQELSSFGRFVGGIVALLYAAFRIDT